MRKNKALGMSQSGGIILHPESGRPYKTETDDYVLSLDPPCYPSQINDGRTYSWFYCSLIWMALDNLFDKYEADGLNGNSRRTTILYNIGRNCVHTQRFFSNMEQGWFNVLKAYDKAKGAQFENVINVIISELVKYFDMNVISGEDEYVEYILDDSTGSGVWHISGPKQNEIVQAFSYSGSHVLPHTPHTPHFSPMTIWGAPRNGMGIKLRDFIIAVVRVPSTPTASALVSPTVLDLVPPTAPPVAVLEEFEKIIGETVNYGLDKRISGMFNENQIKRNIEQRYYKYSRDMRAKLVQGIESKFKSMVFIRKDSGCYRYSDNYKQKLEYYFTNKIIFIKHHTLFHFPPYLYWHYDSNYNRQHFP